MEITGKTLLHLNQTYYFDEDGYECDSLEDARANSSSPDNVLVVRKQNCYIKEFSEMTEYEKDQAQLMSSFGNLDGKLEDFVYVFGASTDRLLHFGYWIDFQEDLANGLYTLVEKKRN